ncbi:guanine nucleotide-binding protein G(I)/G(S)/G(O) subunit gamma-5-like [Branchiostoma floridae x Branchiostoma japonicum]
MSSWGKSQDNAVLIMKKQVEQLRREALMERVKVSQAAADLRNYTQQNAQHDGLLVGIPSSQNPFKESTKCNIL